jgi:hypothetical protein
LEALSFSQVCPTPKLSALARLLHLPTSHSALLAAGRIESIQLL